MGDKNLDTLVEKWMNDASFRAEFRDNPLAAAQKHGITLDAETLSVVQNLGATSAQKLAPRINMDGPNNGC
jgi:putative modified peptide